MILLQLPLWSYLLIAACALAAAAGWAATVIMTRRVTRDRRARAAATLLRTLNDAHVKKAVGIDSRF
jgi:drug/metabolite transporter (DMT)-like permease